METHRDEPVVCTLKLGYSQCRAEDSNRKKLSTYQGPSVEEERKELFEIKTKALIMNVITQKYHFVY